MRSSWLNIGQVLFVRVYTKMESRSITKQKMNEANIYPAILTKQAWSNKGFIVWLLGKFFLQDIVDSPSACSGSQSQSRIQFILPAHRASHIISKNQNKIEILLMTFTSCGGSSSCSHEASDPFNLKATS